MPYREFLDRSLDPQVRGYLHQPETSNGNGLVLTHGAGSNANAPLLIALAEVFCDHGFSVLRCDLPYRQTRSFGPPGPADGARDRAGLKNAATALQKTLGGQGSIYLGGHSYGGRQSSMLCAELSEEEPKVAPPSSRLVRQGGQSEKPASPDPAFVASESISGLLLLSYPLHPPRKPEQQRTQHLPNLCTPTLFVSGTRDPFGSIAEIQQAIKMIPAKTKLLAIEGAGHDLGFKGKTKKEELPNRIYSEFVNFFTI